MALIFCDSWDHYTNILDKWSTAGVDCNIRNPSAFARTGPGMLQINSGSFGPTKKNLPHFTHWIAGIAIQVDTPGAGFNVMEFSQSDTFLGASNVRTTINPDGSVSAVRGNTILGTSLTQPFQNNTYNYVETDAVTAVAPNGRVTIRVNGAVALQLNGINTVADPVFPYNNEFKINGPGGLPRCFIDDVYLLDGATPPNNNFLGPIRIYAVLPDANGAPVQWTPLAGTNFSEVNEVPPDGDASYVFSGNVGDLDQYVYHVGAIPPALVVFGLQHNLVSKLDAAGARLIASTVAGIPGPDIALTGGYLDHTTPYDTNPATGLPWELTDFPATFLGPKVTG